METSAKANINVENVSPGPSGLRDRLHPLGRLYQGDRPQALGCLRSVGPSSGWPRGTF